MDACRKSPAWLPRKRFPVVLLLALGVVPVRASAAAVILFPPDRTLSSEAKIKVFAFQGGTGAPLSVSVNDRPSGKLKGSAFQSGEIRLAPGLNRIRAGGKTIRVYYREGARQENFLFRGERGKTPLVFRPYRLHPALEEGCEGCHLLEDGKWKPRDQKEACYACHPDFGNEAEGKRRYLHEPVAGGECTACHEPHFSALPRLGKSKKGCLECHGPFPSRGSVHRPVKNGRCTDCHDPHAGVAPKQLVREGNGLCTGCHDHVHAHHRGAAVSGSMTRLPPGVPKDGQRLSCLACHAPHQSVQGQLLRESREALCLTCHPR
jgi:predicted CXXCH cytochrome family protein